MTNESFLLIGGNVGCTTLYLRQALYLLENNEVLIKAVSPVYRTAAWGQTQQNDFLNMAIAIDTNFTAEALLKHCLNVEQQLGRVRQQKWMQRTIDIDIIFYNSSIINLAQLKIPHPYMHLRRFVLQPLAPLAANYVHPIRKKTVERLLIECTDDSDVEIYAQYL